MPTTTARALTLDTEAPTQAERQEKIAAAVRRIVTLRFVTGHTTLFANGGTAADRATALVLPQLHNFRADRIPEAIAAHNALVRQLREDLLDGTANRDHLRLVELLYEYLDAAGYMFYYESGRWENHSQSTMLTSGGAA